jgi:hypothetical protein
LLADKPSASINKKHEESKGPAAKPDRLALGEDLTTMRHDLKWSPHEERIPLGGVLL